MKPLTEGYGPWKYAVPDVWQPSLLAGAVGLLRWASRPRQALAAERRQWRQLRSYRSLRRLGILAHFESYPRAAFPPQYDDLLNLYLTIKQRQPAVVLELGGGYSTFVIAHVAAELAKRGRTMTFVSVDESAEWQGVQQQHLPQALEGFVSFHHAPLRTVDWHGETVCAFDSLPVATANFVYVDAGAIGKNKKGVDAARLEAGSPSDYAVLVDGRAQTVELLRRTLARRYRIGPGPNGTQTLFSPTRS